jgi:regulatory protein
MLDIDDQSQQALELAYRYLNQRERTEVEVRRYLERHGADRSSISEVIHTLTGQGYLNDARFARMFKEDRRTLDQWGSDRIRRSLIKRGIEPELVDEVLADDRGAELDQALRLLRRRFPSPPENRGQRERALGVLVRKGYEAELAIDAIALHGQEISAAGRATLTTHRRGGAG